MTLIIMVCSPQPISLRKTRGGSVGSLCTDAHNLMEYLTLNVTRTIFPDHGGKKIGSGLVGMPRVDNSQAIDAFKVFGVAGHEG